MEKGLIVAEAPCAPLPQSKYEDIVSNGYAPAPLDPVSVWNGVLKYQHAQVDPDVVEREAWRYVEDVLDYYFPMMPLYSGMSLQQQAVESALDSDHADKSSGFPWNLMGFPTKKRAIEAFGADALLRYYRENGTMLYGTLKDETRPVGKDARLFRLTSVDAYLEAYMLFEQQNQYLTSRLGEHPIFARFSTPGFDLSRMYKQLYEHNGHFYDMDAAGWDTCFPNVVASFLAYYRSRGRSAAEKRRIYEYYQHMYCGYTVVAGWQLHLIGQSSGHFLTTTDNSLANIVFMSMHAYYAGLSVEEFIHLVRFFDCGDDLVWSDRSGFFTPEAVARTYLRFGMYLEFTQLEPLKFEDLTFVSTHPMFVKLRGVRVISYSYEPSRILGKMMITKKKATPIDKVMRMASYCMLMFNTHYAQFYDILITMIADYISKGEIDPRDPKLLGVMRSTSYSSISDLYWDFE